MENIYQKKALQFYSLAFSTLPDVSFLNLSQNQTTSCIFSSL